MSVADASAHTSEADDGHAGIRRIDAERPGGGNLAQAALLSYVFIKWANIKTFSAGLPAGLVIGFLMTLGHDLVQYDTTNIMDFTGYLANVIAYSLITAIVGGVVGAVIGMGSK